MNSDGGSTERRSSLAEPRERDVGPPDVTRIPVGGGTYRGALDVLAAVRQLRLPPPGRRGDDQPSRAGKAPRHRERADPPRSDPVERYVYTPGAGPPAGAAPPRTLA